MADNDNTQNLGVRFTGDYADFMKSIQQVENLMKGLMDKLASSGNIGKESLAKISQGVKTTNEAISGLKDKTSDFGKVIQNLGGQADNTGKYFRGLGKIVQESTENFNKHTKSTQEIGKEFNNLNGHLKNTISNAKISTDVYNALAKAYKPISEGALSYKKALIESAIVSGNSVDTFNKQATALKNVDTQMRLTKQELSNMNWPTAQIEKWYNGIDRIAAAQKFMNGQLYESQGILIGQGKSFTQIGDALNTVQKEYKNLFESSSMYGREARALENQVKAGTISFNTYQDRLKQTNAGYKELIKTSGDFDKAYQKLNESQKALVRSFAELGERQTSFGANARMYLNSIPATVEGIKEYRENLTALAKAQQLHDEAQVKTIQNQELLRSKYSELLQSGGKYQALAEQVVKSVNNTAHSYNLASNELGKLNKGWGNTQSQMASFEKVVSNSNMSLSNVQRTVSFLREDVAKGNITYNEATQALNKYNASLKNVGTVGGPVQQFLTGLHSRFTGIAATINQSVPYFMELGRAMASMAVWIPAGIAIGKFTEAIGNAVAGVKDFDQSLKTLQAISGGTEAEISVLGDKILQISNTTKYSAAEISKGAVFIAQAGFTAAESIDVIGAAATGAQATLEPLTTAADLLTTVLRAFHKPASDASEVMDILAVAANDSKLNLEGLRTIFNYIGPAAYTVGLSLNETAGAVMVLSNAGLKMSTIGTSLRQVLIGLERPNRTLRQAIKENGMAVDDFKISNLGLIPVLENLHKVMGDDLGKATAMFTVRAGNTAQVLSNMSEYVKILIEDTYQFGIAETMAGKQTEGLTVKLEILGNKFKNMIIRFTQGGTTDAFKLLIDGATTLIELLDKGLNNSFIKTALMVGLFTGAASALYMTLYKFFALSGITFLFEKMTIAIAGYITAAESAMVASGSLQGVLITLRGAFQALLGVMSKHYIIALAMALGSLVLYFYNSKKAAEEEYLQIQKNVVTYKEASINAETLSKKLSDLSVSEQNSGDTLNSYNNILKEVYKNYPQLRKEMTAIAEKYEDQSVVMKKQSELLEKESSNLYKLMESSVAYVVQLNTEKVAQQEASSNWEKLSSNLGQMVVVQAAYVLGTRGMGDAVRDYYYNQNKANRSMLEQIQYNSMLGKVSLETGHAIASLNESEQKRYLDLINNDKQLDIQFKKRVNVIVELSNKYAKAVTRDDAAILASGETLIEDLGDIWQDYWDKQDAKGKLFVSQQALSAEKAAKQAGEATRKAAAEAGKKSLEQQKAYQDAYDAYMADAAEKMIAKRIESFGKILAEINRENKEEIDLNRKKLDITLSDLELKKEQELTVLKTQDLKKEELTEQSFAIERKYLDLSLKAIEENSQKEIELIKANEAKKLELVNNTQVFDTEKKRSDFRIQTERETAEKLASLYERDYNTYTKYIKEKTKEVDRYKNISVNAELYILKIKEDSARITASLEADKRKALQMTMTDEQKYEDNLKAFQENMKKGYAEMANAAKATTKEQLEKSRELAQGYFSDAKSIANTIVKYNQDANGKIIQNEKETQEKRIELYDILEKANTDLTTAQTEGMRNLKKIADESIPIIMEELTNLQTKATTVKTALEQQIRILLETSDAQTKLEALTKEIKDEHIYNIIFKGQASPADTLDNTLKAVKEKLASLNVPEEDMPKVIIKILGQVVSDSSVTLDKAVADVQTYLGLVKTSCKDPITFLVNFIGKYMEGEGSFLDGIVAKVIELIASIKSKTIGFGIDFSGSTGGTYDWIDKVVLKVLEEQQALSAKINALKTVHTIQIVYTSSGGGSSDKMSNEVANAFEGTTALAGGGEVPGVGETDSIPAMLTPGEYVIRKSVVRRLGENFFHALNKGYLALGSRIRKFADGGFASEFPSMSSEFPSESWDSMSSEFPRYTTEPYAYMAGGGSVTSVTAQWQKVKSFSNKINSLETTLDVNFTGTDGSNSSGLSSTLNNLSSKVNNFVSNAEDALKGVSARVKEMALLGESAQYSVGARLEQMRIATNNYNTDDAYQQWRYWNSFETWKYMYADGGSVPGAGDSDSVPAMLTPGEFVIKKSIVNKLGKGFFNMLNGMKNPIMPTFNFNGIAQKFAAGGSVLSNSTETINLNLSVGNVNVPLKVVGNASTVKKQIKALEKELSRMRLCHG